MREFFQLGRDDGLAVTGVGILVEVVLVVTFGWEEFLQRHDLGDDRLGEAFRRCRLGLFSNGPLGVAGKKNDRAILRADVGTLTIGRGRIVRVPEGVRSLPKVVCAGSNSTCTTSA